MRNKMWLKIIWNIVKLRKFPYLYYEINVVENDGDDRIRAKSTSNGVCVHAQKEMVKTVNGFRSSKYRLFLEDGIAESNGVVRIAAKHSKIAVSVHMH